MKREHQAIGYDPRLDRRQPPPLGCVKMFGVALLLLVALVPLGWGISQAIPKPSVASAPTLAILPSDQAATGTPTLEPTASPAVTLATATLDPWSVTGTALAMGTNMDYCWWLTPTAMPAATLPYTPDAWQMLGTETYQTANPPTATPAFPREFCVPPTWTPTPQATATPTVSPTFTPWPLPGGFQMPQRQTTFVTWTPTPPATPAP